MAITSANTNINQMATTSPSAIKKTKQQATTAAQNRNISCKPKGNMAITSANNTKLPKIIGNKHLPKLKLKHNESTKLQGSPTL